MPRAPELVLRVEGKKYSGWKTIRVTRSIEALCGGFALSVSERMTGKSKPWPIREEDECAVLIGDWPVITGYVDKRQPSYSKDAHSFTVAGRDKTSALVDCSADLAKWEFVNVPLKTLAEKLCDPFAISVLVQSGLTLPNVARLSVDPGESAFEALERACRMAGVLPVSDAGDLLLTRAGSARATTELVEGENILEASGDYDATGRFATYKVLGQSRGTDDFFGAGAASAKGTATDEGVRRIDRTLVVRADGSTTSAQAKSRAQWEATVRAARSQTATITVQGWTQNDGSLWAVNSIVRVKSPLIGIDSDMLLAGVTFTLDDGGTKTELALTRPDAFKPQPSVPKKSKGKGASPWTEIPPEGIK
jgi:prophage tail gpP-like protein